MLHHLRLDLCWNCYLAPRILLETDKEYILCKSLPAAYAPRPRQMPELQSAFAGTSFYRRNILQQYDVGMSWDV